MLSNDITLLMIVNGKKNA